jgi:hypothetical protein
MVTLKGPQTQGDTPGDTLVTPTTPSEARSHECERCTHECGATICPSFPAPMNDDSRRGHPKSSPTARRICRLSEGWVYSSV